MTDINQLSTAEAAERAGVSQRHIRRLLTDGSIEGRKLNKWVWLVDRQSLEKWIRNRKSKG
jgi:excisionase family DNA binding protein